VVSIPCLMKGIPVPHMAEEIPVQGRSRLDGMAYTKLRFSLLVLTRYGLDGIFTKLRFLCWR
jgi:hypothetical protein